MTNWSGTPGIVFIPDFVKIGQLVKRMKVETKTHTHTHTHTHRAWPQMFSFFVLNHWKYAKNELQTNVAQINQPSKSHPVPTPQYSYYQATTRFIKIISKHKRLLTLLCKKHTNTVEGSRRHDTDSARTQWAADWVQWTTGSVNCSSAPQTAPVLQPAIQQHINLFPCKSQSLA